MSAAVALARAELLMLARNRTAAFTAVAVPLAGGWFIVDATPADTPVGSVGGIAAFQLLGVVAMTVLTTATMTLVARRQQRVLERWRTSGAAVPEIVAGTLAPVCLLMVAQAAVLFTATGYATGAAPARPELLVLAVVLAGMIGCAAAVITAASTRTVEAAGITTLPVMAALLGGGIWATTAEPGAITWLMRVTGGGAVAELVRTAWDGSPDGGGVWEGLVAAGPSTLALLVLSTAATVAASHSFRWEARG